MLILTYYDLKSVFSQTVCTDTFLCLENSTVFWIQKQPQNVILLGQAKADNNKQMITLTEEI